MQGLIAIERSSIDEDKLIELALESGAQDVQASEEGYMVQTGTAEFEKVRKALNEAKISLISAELTMIPSQTIGVSGEAGQSVQNLIDGLEEHDDVQNVYSNAQWED